MSEQSGPQQLLAALRLTGTANHHEALELLKTDNEARRALVRLAQHPNAAPRDATDAVAWLTREPQPSLRDFYRERLVALSRKPDAAASEEAQALDLAAALAVVGEAGDMDQLATGLAWLAGSDAAGKPRIQLNDRSWWRMLVATIGLSEKGGAAKKGTVNLVRRFVDEDIRRRASVRGDTTTDYQQAGLLFATEYARRRDAGRTTTDALVEIYGASDQYLVRVAAMNALRIVGNVTVPDPQLPHIFPLRSVWERERYMNHVFTWMLQNVGRGYGLVPPNLVLLADGRHPEAPLEGKALEDELRAMRAKIDTEAGVWPTPEVLAIDATGLLTPLLATPALGPGELMRDRRLERPIIGGPL